jgi:putative spermidine/putrescine transport system substrate-binding protein
MTKPGVTRRSVLKGSAAAAGLAAGSGVITGFPTVWAQNIKDIILNHTGQSYSTLIDIARQASADLGFKVEMSVTDHPGMTNRIVNDPKSIDVADTEIWQTKVFVPLGESQAVDIKKIKLWDKMTTLYTQGTFAGKEVSRQGDSPYEIMYRESKEATTFHDGRWSGRLRQ